MPRTRSLVVALMLVGSPVVFEGRAWAQSDEQRAGARTLATEGAQAFNDGRYQDAVELFTKAESLVHAPPHLLFMARAHAKLGQFVRAREAYLKIIKEPLAANAPQAFRDAQAAAEQERQQVEPHIGKLLVKVEGAQGAKDLNVSIDGQPFATVLLGVPQPMDPGEHTVTAVAQGFKAAPAAVSVKAGGQAAVTVKMEVDGSLPLASAPPATGASSPGSVTPPIVSAPVASPPSDQGAAPAGNAMRIGAYVGFGVGAVGLALGTVFVLKSSSNRKDADKAASELEATGCSISGQTCDADSPEARKVNDLDDQARTAKTLGIVGYVVGGLGVATGVTLFVLSKKKEDATAAFVAPYLGLGAAGVRGTF